MHLSDSVQYIKGVGPSMKGKLSRLGIATVEDLVSFYPRRYQDWTKITKMEELRPDDEAVIYGQVADMRKITPRRGLTIVNVLLIDGTGAVTLVYFNQPWKGDAFRKGTYVLAYGRIEYNYGKLQISGAETEFISPDELPSFQKLVPVYPLTEGIRISQMRNMISFALDHVEDMEENLPVETLIPCDLLETPVGISWGGWRRPGPCTIPKTGRSRRRPAGARPSRSFSSCRQASSFCGRKGKSRC